MRHIPRGERSATRQNPVGLTPRQAEGLSLLARGLSNATIAEELFISEKTASHHVSVVLSKLNVSSRLQAAAVATANGWASQTLRQPNRHYSRCGHRGHGIRLCRCLAIWWSGPSPTGSSCRLGRKDARRCSPSSSATRIETSPGSTRPGRAGRPGEISAQARNVPGLGCI